MKKSTKRFLIVVLACVAIVILFFVVCDCILNSKLENYLKNSLPKTVQVDYKDLLVSTRKGEITLTNASVVKKGENTDITYLQLSVDTLLIEDVSYWDYFFNDKISIDNVFVKHPKVIYKYNDQADFKASSMAKSSTFDLDVDVERFSIKQGNAQVFEVETDSLLFKVDNVALQLEQINLSEKTLQNKMPITFKSHQLSFDTLFYQLNQFDDLEIESSKLYDKKITFQGLKLYTKYPKQQFSELLDKERDHFDIKFEAINIDDYDFGFHQGSTFYFKAQTTNFEIPKVSIYRDKLVEDDLTIKPLYSEMLRDLNFNLMLKEVFVNNASIEYYERTKVENHGGKISFSDFNATLKNVGNTYDTTKKTQIDVTSMFMKNAPMKANWVFDVNDASDAFTFNAAIDNLSANAINVFSEPNLKVRFQGDMLKTLFTVRGNKHTSRVDLKTKYKNFDIIALRKDGKRKNKLLSDVLNIFVSKNSDDATNQFRLGYKENVERDKTKSVFNFLWLNVRAGLLDAMTNGVKEQ